MIKNSSMQIESQNLELLDKGLKFYKSGGLSLSACQERLKIDGANEFTLRSTRNLWKIILELLQEPMVYLLLSCALVYFFLGDLQEAILLASFLVLIMGLTITQEAKAEYALEALQKLSSPRAQVLRNGSKFFIASNNIVREDLLFLNEGDRISADGLILSVSQFNVDESLITGESLSVKKEYAQRVYAGTTVTSGQAVVFVTATGLLTELGLIGKFLSIKKQEPTLLETHTRALVGKLTFVAIIICVLIVIIYALTRNDWTQGILTGLTLAMAILPNELPAVLTIFFSMGAWRLSQKKILTRKISAVENLGSITVLCVDKTGTLTLNQMEIQQIYSNNKMVELNNLSVLAEDFHEALEFGILASKRDPYDPMEIAFHKAGKKFLNNTEHLHYDWDLQKEYPLSNELLSISNAWRSPQTSITVVGAKGAPEAIIDLCHLDKQAEKKLRLVAEEMGSKGRRILGIARATTTQNPLPGHQHDFHFSFVGLIGISDPLRPGVAESIKQCHEAGIKVLMLTGDHKATALSIARQIDLQKEDLAITGNEMEEMSDEELLSFAKKGSVFSRIMPRQKLRLVKLLKKSGEIVAMTGDGVNDAPALKEAHIGIAMGGRGTDVAREASHIVLLEDDFASIVDSIKSGRKIYSNIKNALAYLLAIHIPIAGMSIIPVITKLPFVLMPAHIAFLHLIIEPASSVAFEIGPAEDNLMKQKPRSPNEPLFSRSLLLGSFIRGSILLMAILGIYLISFKFNRTESEVRALIFTTLLFANLLLIHYSGFSEESYLKRLIKIPNKVVLWLIAGSLIMLIFSLYQSTFQNLMSFSFLNFKDLLICLGVALLSTFLSEFTINHCRLR